MSMNITMNHWHFCQRNCFRLPGILGVLLASLSLVSAAVKDNNADNINLASSWVGGVVPVGKIIEWDGLNLRSLNAPGSSGVHPA